MTELRDIVLVDGPMFAGKSTHLLAVYQQALATLREDERLLVIKHAIDKRYVGSQLVTSHTRQNTMPAVAVQRLSECRRYMEPGKRYWLLIDEGHFFPKLVRDALRLQEQGHSLVIAALDYDSERRPWEEIALLSAQPRVHTMSLRSTCTSCQRPNSAQYTRRIVNDATERVQVGGSECYQPCCADCWPLLLQS
jgi:thymidine kinase